jgi:SOS response associated peptidase (SRAP)
MTSWNPQTFRTQKPYRVRSSKHNGSCRCQNAAASERASRVLPAGAHSGSGAFSLYDHKRIPPRSSGFVENVESPRSGGGSDSELSPCADGTEGRPQKKSLLAGITFRFRHKRDLPISWNIAPTQDVLAIRFNPESQPRTLDALKQGLIPNWSKDPKIAFKTINARAETADTAPSYREAFKKRRCLIPVDGFYEWKVPGGKIPYSISMKDDSPFVFAGLWEGWKDPANGEWLHT